MNTGTLSKPSSPAFTQRSSTFSSMASPTNTTARYAVRHRFASCLGQYFADLGIAAAAIDFAHQLRQRGAVGNPAGGTAFIQASIVDQTDVETADRGRLPKHVGLQGTRHVPCRLPAHGGIER